MFKLYPKTSFSSILLVSLSLSGLINQVSASTTSPEKKETIISECVLTHPGNITPSNRKTLKLSMIDDGFCDCINGVDEPGTDACSGIGGSNRKTHSDLFLCVNEGSKSKYIYSSHVNDGVCDCCDASDESRASINCKNTCAEDGIAWREQRDQLLKDVEAAQVISQKHHQESKDQEDKWKKEIEEFTKQMVELETNLPGLQKKLQEAEKIWMDEEMKKGGAQATETSTTTATVTSETTTSTVSVPPPPSNDGSEIAEKVEEKETVSEYAKWMDKNAGVGDQASSSDSAHPVTDGEDEGDDNGSAEVNTSNNDLVTDDANASEASKAKNAAKVELDNANFKITESKNQIRALESKLEKLDKYRQYYSLIDKCLQLQTQGYTYKLCFFDQATQDYTRLGNFQAIEKSSNNNIIFKFTGGDMCPGGPARSITVNLKCGLQEQVLHVSEPERCAYTAEMSHPAGCGGELDTGKPDSPEHYMYRSEL